MTTLTDRQLSRLKDEYATAVVENMSHREALSYLRQVIYNDIAVATGDQLKDKIIRAFGPDFYDDLVTDITMN